MDKGKLQTWYLHILCVTGRESAKLQQITVPDTKLLRPKNNDAPENT